MAYRYGNRDQTELLPSAIEDYVSPEDPVRAYDAFVDTLDMKELGIEVEEDQVGNPQYDPKSMLKLLVYGYSYGDRSSRKLERALHHNLSYMWLVGGLRPDHKTIAEFRRKNKKALGEVLRQCARLCLRLGLVRGNTLIVDGTKMRANASLDEIWTKQRCDETLARIDKHIEDVLVECERCDNEESSGGSLLRLRSDLMEKGKLREKVALIAEELKQSGKEAINRIDKDSFRGQSRSGTHTAYNAQITVDSCNGLIVGSDVSSNPGDHLQFAKQITQAEQTLERQCHEAIADAGYHSIMDLHCIAQRGTTVIVPSPLHNMEQRREDRYHREGFTYDRARDCFVCPEGKFLTCRGYDKRKNRKRYSISDPTFCAECNRFKVCTQSPRGRWINRHIHEDLTQRLAKQFEANRNLYNKRQQMVEHPFGHIRHNMGVFSFLMRGLQAVRGEFSLMATGFNLTRMINIMGVPGLIAALSA